jgi:hypothetical protein
MASLLADCGNFMGLGVTLSFLKFIDGPIMTDGKKVLNIFHINFYREIYRLSHPHTPPIIFHMPKENRFITSLEKLSSGKLPKQKIKLIKAINT